MPILMLSAYTTELPKGLTRVVTALFKKERRLLPLAPFSTTYWNLARAQRVQKQTHATSPEERALFNLRRSQV
jgi:hypothetical protein